MGVQMNNTVQLLFFAALAEQVQCEREQVALPPGVDSVAGLQQWLAARGGAWSALTREQVRCAVNQEIATITHPVRAGDEVAFFPPVTGG